MPDKNEKNERHQDYTGGYVIRVTGRIDPSWSEWLEGLSISYEGEGDTVLSGQLADQAALHGLLARIRDLNLTLLSVNRIEVPQLDNRQIRQGD